MKLTIYGINHKTAPVEIREKLAFPAADIQEALRALVHIEPLLEGVLLSTCNRTEVYVVTRRDHEPRPDIEKYLLERCGVNNAELQEAAYCFTDDEAVRHLFRVTSSLDSMVLGETQIIGQVREAYLWASETGTTGKFMNELFQTTLRVGKDVYTRTGLSTSHISVSSVAADFARNIFHTFDRKTLLVIGAGETAELTARAFKDTGISHVRIVNRTYERARELAEYLQGEAVPFEKLEDALLHADIIVTAVASPDAVLTHDHCAACHRTERPLTAERLPV
jgi:glutamyl-tRNA reductase